eukprot:TRINITY_DN33281_c0_g1_i1.p1 TRINITY_DN33281_c0_g1~~TRINITY_DN33281_c0_g1_i1.p1  ORF type:complete len:1150 (+),score=460.99 TRINITY_DN33281_c0_g1_i1:62-3511(+)
MSACDMEELAASKNRFQRISKPLHELKPSYDVIVIGSGYGGGVAASRLSRAGKSVCMLERGKEILPGDYPATLPKALDQLQIDSVEGKVGSSTGLYNLHMGRDQFVMVGCGLGGTSLINANVSLEATEDVFQNDNWPEKFRDNSSTLLKEAYVRARDMLKPNVYPDSYPPLAKFDAHKKSAESMGQEENFKKTPINVTFETPASGVNHVGVPQVACNNCGDCCSGCNVGAKNTTLMNYLPDAFNHGTDIFCEIHVEYIEKTEGDKWLVHYTLAHTGQEKFKAPTMTITADIVMLAAGTIGSNEIMLRTKEKGLSTSDMVGRRFSGNGDILGFGYNCDDKINGIGYGIHDPKGLEPVGPCITSVIDMRHEPDNMVIEEGSVPGCIGKPFAGLMATANRLIGENTEGGLQDVAQKIFRQTFFRPPYQGAANHTQTYLIMSHDDGRGVLKLKNNRLDIDWPGVGKQENFYTGNENMKKCTAALKGNYVKNPMWTKIVGKDVISVHPLGGCCMATNATNGVVDHKGRVFSGKTGENVHKGLYICDGSIIPTSLAVNPLLTITACAERACVLLAEDYGLKIDYTLPSATKRPHYVPKVGIEFTETMRGEVSDVRSSSKLDIQFTLTVRSDDLDTMLNTPEHKAHMNGTVTCPVIDPQPLSVVNGEFQLFVQVPSPPNTRHMVYAMPMYTKSGKAYYLYGYKTVQDHPNLLRIWHDTSTLDVKIYEGDSTKGREAYKGTMHIRLTDFAKQMTTMRVLNAKNEKERLMALAKFGINFAGVLWNSYGGIFAPRDVYDPNLPPRKKRPLAKCVPVPELHYFNTKDQVTLRLTRYQSGKKGPVMLVHGLGVSSEIFSTDLVDVNMVEYLCANKYDVWLLDFRVSILLPAADQQSTGDQVAEYDYPAAVAKIREVTKAPSVQAVVHCWGAATFFMSLLRGLEGIRSVVASQVATHAVMKLVTNVKSGLRLPKLLSAVGFKYLTTYVDTNEGLAGRIVDKGLAVYAMAEAQGQCNSPVCHRITFNYASLYRHAQLDQRLHENLHELFAEANITAFEHLAMICRKGQLVSADGKDVYMPHIENLNLPIMFISGHQNECYLPESTKKTYDMLVNTFGQELYKRVELDNYGHIDCIFGTQAHKDVFPDIVKRLDETALVSTESG